MKRVLSLVLAMLMTMAIVPLASNANAAEPPKVPAGGEFIRISTTVGDKDLFVDVPAEGVNNDGQQLQIWELYPGNINQIYYIVNTSNGYQIYSAASGKVLAVKNDACSDWTPVIQSNNLTTPSSYWEIVDTGNGSVAFRNRHSGLYLNVSNGNFCNGTRLITYHDDGTSSMRFRIKTYTNPFSFTVPTRAIWYRPSAVMVGRDVGYLQCSMILFGNYGLTVDQSYGSITASTAKKMQSVMGIEPDGSCGNITQQHILRWLNSFAIKPRDCLSGISTARIQAVLDQHKCKDGWYWVYSAGGKCDSGYTATTQNRGRSYSYNFDGSVECAGFAGYIMSQVTGSYAYGGRGWTRIEGENNISELRLGDIIRTSGHSAIVLSINSDGTITFAECWGSYNCMINIGKFNNCCSTLQQIKNKYTVSHIWRYIG